LATDRVTYDLGNLSGGGNLLVKGGGNTVTVEGSCGSIRFNWQRGPLGLNPTYSYNVLKLKGGASVKRLLASSYTQVNLEGRVTVDELICDALAGVVMDLNKGAALNVKSVTWAGSSSPTVLNVPISVLTTPITLISFEGRDPLTSGPAIFEGAIYNVTFGGTTYPLVFSHKGGDGNDFTLSVKR
jgi:hypothetical protein